MKRTLLTIVVALAISVVAQAQETVKHMLVKHIDGTETSIPVSDVYEVTFVDKVTAFVPKPFSVSDSQKVYFSPGNLQYQASTDTWRFAEHQYDIIGEENDKISESYDGWIDLFGWGTGDNPTMSTEEGSQYSPFVDWGKHINDGDTWFTLTMEQWEYFYKNHEHKMTTVHGMPGCVFLPDEATVSINAHWYDLEAAGALFLPSAGYRWGLSSCNFGYGGVYWSSTPEGPEDANGMYFGTYVTTAINGRYTGQSIRLVRLVQDE